MTNQILQGILLGGYYALIACGLSFMFSVMRIINLAHGSLAVAAAYLIFVLTERAQLPLWASFLVSVAAMAVAGWLIQRLILDRSARGGQLLPILSTFGLSMVIDNTLFEQFGADTRSLANSIGDLSWDSWELPGGLYVGKLPVLIFVTAVALLAALQLMLTYTRLGRAIRATAEDPDTAGLVGIDACRVNAAAAAITLSDDAQRNVAWHAVATRWSENDPASLAAHAWSLDDESLRGRALDSALPRWLERDEPAALAWDGALPSSRASDPAVALVAGRPSLIEHDPELAVCWAETIADANLRSRTLAAITRAWRYMLDQRNSLMARSVEAIRAENATIGLPADRTSSAVCGAAAPSRRALSPTTSSINRPIRRRTTSWVSRPGSMPGYCSRTSRIKPPITGTPVRSFSVNRSARSPSSRSWAS